MAIFNVPKQSFRWLFAELTVVVLGVLIAFQVEEWRNSQTQEEFQEAMLDAILLDLQDEQREISIFIDMAARQIQASQDLIALLNSEEPATASELVDLFRTAWVSRTWLPNGATYNSLIQTGNLSQLSDDELQQALFDYYAWTGYIGIQTESFLEVVNELVSAAYLDFHFQPFDSAERIQPYTYPIVAIEPVAEIPRNPLFLGTLGNFGRRISQLRPLLMETQQRNQSLQQTIQQALQ